MFAAFPLRRRLLISALVFSAAAASARAVTFDEANALLVAGNHAKAAEAYEELIAKEGASASRLYNLGNARFGLKQNGPAILAYERAALLAPRDPDIAANLKLARQAAATYTDTPSRPWWEAVLHRCSLSEWSWITLGGALAMGAAALVAGAAGLSRKWSKRSFITGLITGVLAASLGGFALWHRRGETKLGIVTADGATLRLSPFKEAEAAGTPGTGRKVELGERSHGWVYVSVPGSAVKGWLPESDAASIIPPEAAP